MIGSDLLYRELGNPFDLGNGCGRLDGMPISCSKLQNRMDMGNVAFEYRSEKAQRVAPKVPGLGKAPLSSGPMTMPDQIPIKSLGLGLFKSEVPFRTLNNEVWATRDAVFSFRQDPQKSIHVDAGPTGSIADRLFQSIDDAAIYALISINSTSIMEDIE